MSTGEDWSLWLYQVLDVSMASQALNCVHSYVLVPDLSEQLEFCFLSKRGLLAVEVPNIHSINMGLGLGIGDLIPTMFFVFCFVLSLSQAGGISTY